MKPFAPPARAPSSWAEHHPFLVLAAGIVATFAVAGALWLLFDVTDRCPPGNGAPAAITTRDFAGREVVYVPKGC